MRKLSWIIAGILCTAPVFVHAAELGEARIASHLTERLDVKIPITGLDGVPLDQVKVRLAPEKYYQQAGLSLDGLAGNITFQIESAGTRHYLVVRSKRAITNPILSLLIQFNAGDSAQVKEFDLLLDPPVYTQRPVKAASSNSFTGHVAASAPTASSPAWRPVPNVPNVKMGGTYKVKSGDTLYTIAKTAAAGQSVSVRPMMQAIINANPDAFVEGNGNLLIAGSTLKVPERVASATVAAAGTAATAKAAGAQSSKTPSMQVKPKLQLLGVEADKEKAAAANAQTAASAADAGGTGGSGAELPAVEARAVPTEKAVQLNNEAIASIDAKNEVMSKQISLLNDQLKQVQGLVSERNQSVEQLQEKIKQANEQTQLLKRQLEAQNNNFWLKWAPYLMGGAGLLIIILLLMAISLGRKRKVAESTTHSMTNAVIGESAGAMQPPKAEDEPRIVADVQPMVSTMPSSASTVDSKSVIDEARLLLSYNLYAQAFDLIEEAIAQQPDELSLYQELAMMYSQTNNTAELEKVLARIDEKFGAENRPSIDDRAIYATAPAPQAAETEADTAKHNFDAPAEHDALDAIPETAFAFDAGLDLPTEKPNDTSSGFEVENQPSSEVGVEGEREIRSLEDSEELASTPETFDLELGDALPQVAETKVGESLSDQEPVEDSAAKDDTRLGLAEAFLGVGDQESYQMIAEEIESEGNPAIIAALKKIEQKFS